MPHNTPAGNDDNAADVSIKPPDVVEFRGVFGFAETIDRLQDEIAGRGLQVFARIDHAANAVMVGLDMPPATVLVLGNARGGTPLMLKAPALALDLPLRVLVRQDEDGVLVSYRDPVMMLASFGLSASDAAPLQALAAIAQMAAQGNDPGRGDGEAEQR
jgi:uncharacterized protein (DUF302 family)